MGTGMRAAKPVAEAGESASKYNAVANLGTIQPTGSLTSTPSLASAASARPASGKPVLGDIDTDTVARAVSRGVIFENQGGIIAPQPDTRLGMNTPANPPGAQPYLGGASDMRGFKLRGVAAKDENGAPSASPYSRSENSAGVDTSASAAPAGAGALTKSGSGTLTSAARTPTLGHHDHRRSTERLQPAAAAAAAAGGVVVTGGGALALNGNDRRAPGGRPALLWEHVNISGNVGERETT